MLGEFSGVFESMLPGSACLENLRCRLNSKLRKFLSFVLIDDFSIRAT
jgi:hypothetical protein